MAWKGSASFDFFCGVNLHLKEKEGKRKLSSISGMSHEVNAQHDCAKAGRESHFTKILCAYS